MIVGASDRMLTAGDIQFEQPLTKQWLLNLSTLCLISGDMTIQDEILTQVEQDPENLALPVKMLAEKYQAAYLAVFRKRIETTILARFNLTYESFLHQKEEKLPSNLVDFVDLEIKAFNPPALQGIEAIITGIDADGPHIYVFRHSDLMLCNTIGFAAIGIGAWHAESQFMFEGHSYNAPVDETMLLTYSAKKRAEVAPGVGKHTDLFTIFPDRGPAHGCFLDTPDFICKELEIAYRATLKRDQRARTAAKRRYSQAIQGMIDRASEGLSEEEMEAIRRGEK